MTTSQPPIEAKDVEAWVACPHCRAPLDPDSRSFDLYFSGEHGMCPGCARAIDWWQAVLAMIEHHFVFGHALALAGAQRTVLQTTLKPGETKELDLVAKGVPENAELLQLNLTSGGSALPVVLHDNEIIRDPIGPRLLLLGRPVAGVDGNGPLNVLATWFVRRSDDTVIRHLVEAGRHYQAARFDAVVIPANIAAEVSVSSAIMLGLRGFGRRKNVEDLLSDGATYSHQIKILLGLMAFLPGAPPLPGRIRNLLDELRKARNDVVHSGACPPLDRSKAAEYFAAAIFVVHYARLLKEKFEAARTAGRLPWRRRSA